MPLFNYEINIASHEIACVRHTNKTGFKNRFISSKIQPTCNTIPQCSKGQLIIKSCDEQNL